MIENNFQLQNTQLKLSELEERIRAKQEKRKTVGVTAAEELSLSSMCRLRNELLEEISWYKAHQASPAKSTQR